MEDTAPLTREDIRQTETQDALTASMNLFASCFEGETKEDGMFAASPLRREIPGRIFQDASTGQVHVYVSRTENSAVNGIPAVHTRPRWKPNSTQLQLLERHFDAGKPIQSMPRLFNCQTGFSKATPELHAAVRAAGDATETQVNVWLKNRLARSKRALATAKSTSSMSERTSGYIDPDPYHKRLKRQSEPLPHQVDEIGRICKAALTEISNALYQTSSVDVQFLVSELIRRQKLCFYGVGRERCVLEAFVVRLKQLGLDAHLIGQSSPCVGPRDLLLASAGPSFFNTVSAICLAAIRAKAHVILLTSHRTAPVPFADTVIRIPAPHVPSPGYNPLEGNEIPRLDRFLPLGSAYESTLWMLCEILGMIIQREKGITENDMLMLSGNLE